MEFLNLWWLGVCPNGELLAGDPKLGRVKVISPVDGRLLRTVRLPAWVLFNEFLSCEESEQLLVLLARPRELGQEGRITRSPATLVRFRLGQDSPDSLIQLAGTEYYFAAHVAGYSPVPLGAAAHAASNGGYVYAAQNDENQIRVLDSKTGRRWTFEHNLHRARVAGAAWSAARRELIDQLPLPETRKLVARVLAEAPAPDLQPAFVDMKADRAGRLWLRLPSLRSVATWRVVSPQGKHVASVALPATVEPLDIGDRYLVALARDAMGVQSVVIHTFRQPLIPRRAQ
ncbi:MAG: hypothetical protein ACT443_02065 [Gemmatimonadota bacterium]